MQFISEWILNIVTFILLAMIVDMLLPDSPIKKYVKLVVGLLLITIAVTPIFKVFSSDFDEVLNSFVSSELPPKAQVQKTLNAKKSDIETSSHAYILEQMAVQLKDHAEKEMIDHHGMTITHIQIKAQLQSADAPDHILENIQKITVHVKPQTDSKMVAEVEQVSIQIRDETVQVMAHSNEKIKEMLAEKWDVPASKIELQVKGGTDSR
ncbi:stage III sporulation protein AF [Siminovitchia sediminis]|uniref:Stage III sporulation protein AF n=1 Tax=Siminovitchia sediminis TaxID=1274353 RepID=A0ABW4KHM7_9BACI